MSSTSTTWSTDSNTKASATSSTTQNVSLDGTLTIAGATALSSTLTIAGATQLNSTLTIGENDTGYDVIFYGAQAGSHLKWDESHNNLILQGSGAALSFWDGLWTSGG